MASLRERSSRKRSFQQDLPLAWPVQLCEEQPRLRVQRLCQRLRLVERLRERESPLEVREGTLVLAAEVQEASELSRDGGDVRLRARRLQRHQCRLDALRRARWMSFDEVDIGE